MSAGTNRTATSVEVAGMPPISSQPSSTDPRNLQIFSLTAPTHHPVPDPESLEHSEEHRHEALTLPLVPTPPTQSGNSRERSRSHSRSPRRHRHHRRRSRFRFKEKERNFLAAVCSMIVIVTLCTALAEPNWFYMRGGGCRANDDDKSPIHTLGVYQFFYIGQFGEDTTQVKSQATRLVYHYNGGNSNDVMINCVTQHIVQVLRSIIVLCFFGVVFSLIAFFLDLAGPSHRMMKTIRRNAVFNILTVVVCVMVNGFSFLITQLLESLQNQTKEHRYSKIDIRFDVSFYLVAAAGAVSVIAAAFNLLRRYPPYDQGGDQRELLEDYDNMDIGALHGADIYASYTPPPPAYSP